MGFISVPLVWVQVNLLTFKVALECLYSCSSRFFRNSHNFCNICCVLLAKGLRRACRYFDDSMGGWREGEEGIRVLVQRLISYRRQLLEAVRNTSAIDGLTFNSEAQVESTWHIMRSVEISL